MAGLKWDGPKRGALPHHFFYSIFYRFFLVLSLPRNPPKPRSLIFHYLFLFLILVLFPQPDGEDVFHYLFVKNYPEFTLISLLSFGFFTIRPNTFSSLLFLRKTNQLARLALQENLKPLNIQNNCILSSGM